MNKTNLKRCPDCGNGVSPDARRCPQCGHTFTTPMGLIIAIIIGLIIGVILFGSSL